jgi:hypothetical protein
MPGTRKPNLPAAALDLAFAIGAGAAGAFGWGWPALFGILIAHVVFWAVSRQSSLAKTPRAHLAPTLAISIALIALVDIAAFLIASLFRG